MDDITLRYGDCLEVMKEIPDGSVDMILCDLPYGTTACKWDKVLSFQDLWKEYNRVTKNDAAIVLFAAQLFTSRLINSNLKDFRYTWYWKKSNVTGFSYARFQPMRCIEDICVFYKKKPTYNPQGLYEVKNPKTRQKKDAGKDMVYSMDTLCRPYVSTHTNYPKHLLEFKNDATTNRLHPTQKPVALLEYLIKTYTDEGETVMDNCMGSGSTGVACVNTGRKFIGIEKDKHYFDTAEGRINNARNNKLA